MQFLGKPLTVMMMITSTLLLVFLISSLASTISLHNMVYAQNSNTTELGSTTNLIFNGKSIPIKYNITTAAGGKLLGLVEDKDKTTLIALISSPSDKGTLTIEVPRTIVDDKKEGNADDKFAIHVDGSKDATFRETSNNKTARTLAIDFNKDARMIEIIGNRATVP
jgi:hypothetical protein